jgi:hypothetical protein
MRMLIGLILGFFLTVAGAYLFDTMRAPPAKPMVNWDVVSQQLETLTGMARDGWKKIAG